MGKKLFVGNLDWSVKDEDLKQAFDSFGEVTSARVVTDRMSGRSRGFGFVEYATDDAAETAKQQMNGKELKGRAIRVDIAQETPPRER
jgi:RNA recognition motif-containing protein